MTKIISLLLSVCLLFSFLLLSCSNSEIGTDNKNENTQYHTTPVTDDDTPATEIATEKTEIPTDLEEDINTLSISCSEGTDQCWTIENKTLTFSDMSENTICSLSGNYSGQIVIDCNEDIKFELELCGVTLYSSSKNPITVLSGKEITLTAKKDTQNYIYDTREAVGDDEETYSSAIWSNCDLEIGGKGELTVVSSHNNGIHTKDDLQVKNLTLYVTCEDNALKGNDSVEISSGNITLIAKTGDGIKTTNTDISSKGNQRGTVTITGGNTTIYAACDGIDAAYDADISEEAFVQIYTDRYSPYSENVETSNTDHLRFIRFTYSDFSYSIKYYNSDSDYQWVNASLYKTVNGGRSTYYYYSFEAIESYSTFQIFIYQKGQAQGQEDDCLVQSDYLTWNTAYDTFALEQRGSSLTYNWTNYTTTINDMGGFGGMGGMGGMQDGNTEKSDYSTKGMKAGNEIHISGGAVEIKSYDDALHTSNDSTLENGNTPTGNVVISGGTLTLFSKDDGIHADGELTISGGSISITGSYEGLEGTTIVIKDGDISIVSSDDGINSTATTNTGITFLGGSTYIYAGGDGIDANSRTQYKGIFFAGGTVTVISTSSNNSSIDTEQGYTYTGGSVLALCPSTGMGSESTNCSNFSSIGTKANISLKSGQTLVVQSYGKTVASVEMPCALSALAIYLGAYGATFSTK